tara:strand:- start:25 stop:1521 length:1497 start_codon:yes stop_codon:yes gene_type:complete
MSKELLTHLLNDSTANTLSNSIWGIVPIKGRVINMSFITEHVAEREPYRIKSGEGWTNKDGVPLNLDYGPGSLDLKSKIELAFIRAREELSRVGGIRFIFTPDDQKSDINYFINEETGSSLPVAQTVVSDNFESAEDDFALIGFNNYALIDGSAIADQGVIDWLVLHEMLHPFGFQDIRITSKAGTEDDLQSETILSYRFGNSELFHDIQEVVPLDIPDNLQARTSLSIADTWALQQVVGANEASNVGNNNYKLTDLTYTTIWDAGGENDTIDASDLGGGNIITDPLFDQGVTIDLRQGQTSSFEVGGYQVGIAFGAVIENAIGSDDDDIIVGNSVGNTILANDGADYIFGSAEALREFQESPFDYVSASDAVDLEFINTLLVDASDEDWTYDGLTNGQPDINGERPDAEDDDDIIFGGAGDDRIFGGDGFDTIIAGDGDDVAFGGAIDDIIFGGKGDDELVGEEGRDILLGGDDSDTLYGDDRESGNDVNTVTSGDW